MAEGENTPAIRGAAWILLTLTVLNLLNYIDRSVLPAVLAQMKRSPIFAGRSESELGALSFYFLITYMVVSPLAGLASAHVPRKYLIAAGVLIWSAATFATGLARTYGEVRLARTFVGFGEAGYATVAPAMIVDLFSSHKRARMLSVFYLAIPVGTALGYVLGGNITYGWRSAFFVAGGPGLLFGLIALILPEPRRGGSQLKLNVVPFGTTLRLLLRNRPFLYTAAGGALMTFTLGAAAYWFPKYLQEIRHMKESTAGNYFGTSIILAGIIGTALGGVLADRWIRKDRGAYFLISGLGLCAGVPFLVLAPFMPTPTTVIAASFFAMVLLFLNTGPLNAAIMDAAPPNMRETAMGLNILIIHLFGDAISPTAVGFMVDRQKAAGVTAGSAWNLALATLALPVLLGGVTLLIGARAMRRATP